MIKPTSSLPPHYKGNPMCFSAAVSNSQPSTRPVKYVITQTASTAWLSLSYKRDCIVWKRCLNHFFFKKKKREGQSFFSTPIPPGLVREIAWRRIQTMLLQCRYNSPKGRSGQKAAAKEEMHRCSHSHQWSMVLDYSPNPHTKTLFLCGFQNPLIHGHLIFHTNSFWSESLSLSSPSWIMCVQLPREVSWKYFFLLLQ